MVWVSNSGLGLAKTGFDFENSGFGFFLICSPDVFNKSKSLWLPHNFVKEANNGEIYFMARNLVLIMILAGGNNTF